MFKEPEKHLCVAITKAKMAEMSFDYDDILPTALGEEGQHVSFKGYNVIQVEQDDQETIIEMIDEVNKMGDVKPYVKQGFFDFRKIEEIFNSRGNKISQVLDPKNQGCELVNLLIPIFNKAVP